MTLYGAVFGRDARAAESAGDRAAERAGGSATWAAGAAAAPIAASREIRAARRAARTRERPRGSFLREEMGDGQEDKENAAEDIDSDHHAPVELRSQGRVSQQIVETLGERHKEHEQEDGPPSPQQGEDGDQDDDRDQE